MSNRDNIVFNDNEFKEALSKYVDLSSKSASSAINAKLKDLLYRAARETPKATRQEINALKTQAWWIKYLAKRVKRHLGGKKVDKKTYLATYKKVEREILASRKRATGYLRSGYVQAARKIQKYDREQREGREVDINIPRRFAQIKTLVAESKPKSLSALADINWQSRDMIDASGKGDIVTQALNKAKPQVTRDMYKYIDRKLKQHSKKISAR